jgi:hypothetical protein
VTLTTPQAVLAAVAPLYPSVPGVGWVDLPAALYALAVVESNLDLDAGPATNGGEQSVGPWQVNLPTWQSQTGAPPTGGTIGQWASWMKPVVATNIVGGMQRANSAILDRAANGERDIFFNPVFDAPLWVSIAWQFGPDPLVAWASTPGAQMGQKGFESWYLQKHGRAIPVEWGYGKRQPRMRAAYVRALSMEKVLAGLADAARATKIDYLSSGRDGFLRLAQIATNSSVVEMGRSISQEIQRLAVTTCTGMSDSECQAAHLIQDGIKVFHDAVAPVDSVTDLAIPLGLGLLILGAIAWGSKR